MYFLTGKDIVIWKELNKDIVNYLKEKLEKKYFKQIRNTYLSSLILNNLFYIYLKYVNKKSYHFFNEIFIYKKNRLNMFLVNRIEDLQSSPLLINNIVILRGKKWLEYFLKLGEKDIKKKMQKVWNDFLLIQEIDVNEGVIVLKKNIWRIKIYREKFTAYTVKEGKEWDLLTCIRVWVDEENTKKEKEKKIVMNYLSLLEKWKK